MRRLRKGGGGRVAGLPPHVSAWEGTGKALDMEERGYGGGEGGKPHTYRIDSPKGGAKACPVEGCPGREGIRTAMQVHFWRQHVRYIVIILEEGKLPHPRCPRCDMFVPWRALNIRHKSTEMCRCGADKKRRPPPPPVVVSSCPTSPLHISVFLWRPLRARHGTNMSQRRNLG